MDKHVFCYMTFYVKDKDSVDSLSGERIPFSASRLPDYTIAELERIAESNTNGAAKLLLNPNNDQKLIDKIQCIPIIFRGSDNAWYLQFYDGINSGKAKYIDYNYFKSDRTGDFTLSDEKYTYDNVNVTDMFTDRNKHSEHFVCNVEGNDHSNVYAVITIFDNKAGDMTKSHAKCVNQLYNALTLAKQEERL